MKTSSLHSARGKIVRFFDGFSKKVFTLSDIHQIVQKNRTSWGLAKSVTTPSFIEFLIENAKLKSLGFRVPSSKIIRYLWGEASAYELALSLHPKSYFTHLTAMQIHKLTKKNQRPIYLNMEQPPKDRFEETLEQKRIDAAFKKSVRASKTFILYEGAKIFLLRGMHTGQLGVIQTKNSLGESVRVTNLERTLIDITVRPVYSGGVSEVLKAYQSAQPHLSTNKLSAILKELDYIYPYYQAIGFYLERSDVYSDSQIDIFRKQKKEYDFYLTHRMGETVYSKEWRIYYPRNL